MHSHTCMWYFVSVAIRLTWEDNDSLLYPYVPTRTLRLFYFHLLVCVFTLLLPRYFIDSLTQLLTRSLARAASLTTNLKRLHIYSSGSRSLEFKFLGAETLTVDTGSDLDIKGQPDWYMYFFSHSATGMETWIEYWTIGPLDSGPFLDHFSDHFVTGEGRVGVMVDFAACRCTPLSISALGDRWVG